MYQTFADRFGGTKGATRQEFTGVGGKPCSIYVTFTGVEFIQPTLFLCKIGAQKDGGLELVALSLSCQRKFLEKWKDIFWLVGTRWDVKPN